jgi:prepilin-type N-terminal cleavage/methylation domain-containing protein
MLRYRSAFTLLEMMVATAIFAALLTALLSSWAAGTNFSFMVNQSLVRMETINSVRKNIQDDFAQSSWFYQFDANTNLPVPDAKGADIVLFPTSDSATWKGREIRFTRFRTALTIGSTPTLTTYTENLIGTDAVTLSYFDRCPPSPFFILNVGKVATEGAFGQPGVWNISPVWESSLTGLSFAENADKDHIRLYRYVLVPYSATTPASLADTTTYATTAYPSYASTVRNGPYTAYENNLLRGMLLRQYRNPGSPTWVTIGQALSDQIVFYGMNDETDTATDHPCFVFSTFRDTWITRSGNNLPGAFEIRLRMSMAAPVSANGPPNVVDLRLSCPLKFVDYGT